MHTRLKEQNQHDYLIARNILAQKQFNAIAVNLMQNKILFMPIKGIVLLDILYKDLWERYLSDIDLLVKYQDLSKIHHIMLNLGYLPGADNPCEWQPKDIGLPIDIHTDIWYLSSSEMKQLWQKTPIKIIADIPCQVMPKEEIIIHTIAHAFIHHGHHGGDWKKDIVYMLSNWRKTIDIHNLFHRLTQYNMLTPFRYAFAEIHDELPHELTAEISFNVEGKKQWVETVLLKKFLSLKHSLKGRILRFIFQRNIVFKIGFILKTLFPPPYIMKRRYNIGSFTGLIAAYFLRPFSCMIYTITIFARAVKSD